MSPDSREHPSSLDGRSDVRGSSNRDATATATEDARTTLAGTVEAVPAPAAIPHGMTSRDRLPWLLTGGLGEALWLFVTLRLAFSLFGLMAAAVFSLRGPCSWANGPLRHATGLDFRLLGVWQRWDVCWYEKVAAVGYRHGDPSVNFFPLFPLLMRGAAVVLGGNVTLGGMVVSGLAYVAAMVGLYQLVRDDFDALLARRTVLYLSIFPGVFFLFIPYSEATFLALAVWTLYTARRGWWKWAAVTGFLVGLTRMQGCLLALPLAYEAIKHWRAGRRQPAQVIAPLLPLGSLLAFLAYSKAVANVTALTTQRTIWVNTPRAPWTVIALSWQHIVTHNDVIEALNLTMLTIVIALLLLGLRELPLSYTLYAAPQVLLVIANQRFLSPLESTIRYVLVIFPAFVLLALLGRRRRVHDSWLIISLLLLGFLLYTYLRGAFVA